MPLTATCPRKGCGGNWTITDASHSWEPVQCRCGETFRFDLICPHCPSLDWTPATGATAGGQARCRRAGHTFTVPVWDVDCYTTLARFGTRVHEYRQSAHIAALGAADRRHVAAGFCRGAVLNWLRRELLGSKRALSDAPKPKQDELVARLQVMYTPLMAKARADYNAQEERRHDAVRAGRAQVDQLNARYNAAKAGGEADLDRLRRALLQRASEQGWSQDDFDRADAEVVRRFDAKAALLKQAKDRKVAELHAAAQPHAGPQFKDVFWSTFSSVVDTKLLRGRQTSAARLFANMCVERAEVDVERRDVRTLVGEALAATRAGQGVCIAIKPPTANASGHAVGVARRNTDQKFLFFDPNFGVWEATGTGAVEDAMDFLFRSAYPHAGGRRGPDQKAYVIGGKVRGDYLVFARTG